MRKKILDLTIMWTSMSRAFELKKIESASCYCMIDVWGIQALGCCKTLVCLLDHTSLCHTKKQHYLHQNYKSIQLVHQQTFDFNCVWILPYLCYKTVCTICEIQSQNLHNLRKLSPFIMMRLQWLSMSWSRTLQDSRFGKVKVCECQIKGWFIVQRHLSQDSEMRN